MVWQVRRICAWVAMATFCATFALGPVTAGHFGPDDDAACGQVSLAAGHARVQFEPVRLAPPATHCPLCHWQRVVSGADLVSPPPQAHSLQPLDRVPPSGPQTERPGQGGDRFSRGPPFLL